MQLIDQTVDRLFRTESGKMVSVLVGLFGIENLTLAEDVVQESLIAAMDNWKYKGVPDNPQAWLYRVAKNKAIDAIRHNKRGDTFDFSDPDRQLLKSEYSLASTVNESFDDHKIKDDFLGMMYACCHADLTVDSQITLILKSLCGFSTKELARAFLCSEDTVSKRLYRTKEFFRKNKIKPAIPPSGLLAEKTGSVLRSIYMIFNEGHCATHNDDLVRSDLISQSMWLCKSLIENQTTRLPEVYALMALMCFHAARTEGRFDSQGELILLAHQDRSKWNRTLIDMGSFYMSKAAHGDYISDYHVEAAISYEHCKSKTYAETNWKLIIRQYDYLLQRDFDPVISLNRALAILEMDGAQSARYELQKLDQNKLMEGYYLYHAAWGEVHFRLGNQGESRNAYQRAMELTHSTTQKRFLAQKIESVSR